MSSAVPTDFDATRFIDRRRAGILLHPTSLPGNGANGDLGEHAYRFVDFMAHSGLSVWQFLPTGPTHDDGSPYQCLSVHAGNPKLISRAQVVREGWLNGAALDDGQRTELSAWLRPAMQGFHAAASDEARQAYRDFTARQGYWLEDYALFQALRREQGHRHWIGWPVPLRDRDPQALQRARQRCAESIEQVRFEQFLFYRQWHALKRYANSKGIWLFGDLPIFVAHDSADVWAQREQFAMNECGELRAVAGVPPDYFSETGQLWGNPHYDWERMRAENFRWWIDRVRSQLEMVDLLRIDHFRGFESFWEIPAGAETAQSGRWVKAPGHELFNALHAEFPHLRVVAEDLGVITPEVNALRHAHGFPGMKILQFAFDGDAANPYLPHHHEAGSVAYTGTHDNATTVGWFQSLPPPLQQRVYEYLGYGQEPMPWPLIRATFASVARLAMVPMQDVLGLGAEHRMNTPGTMEGNWHWRFDWAQMGAQLPERLRRLTEIYGRT